MSAPPVAPRPEDGGRRPPAGPTAQELAAIVAAVELVWPRPVVVAAPTVEAAYPWRFSGRWWARPAPVRRERPWLR